MKKAKMAHVVKCKNCEHQFWGKTKTRYSECPNCEAKCLIVNPSEISIKERERMWRILDDIESRPGHRDNQTDGQENRRLHSQQANQRAKSSSGRDSFSL